MSTHRTKRTRRMNAEEIAFDLAARREKAGRERAEARQADRDAAQWGVNRGALALPANADTAGENRAGDPRPVRKDVFAELHDRRRDGGRGDRCLPTESFNAVRRLETAMVTRLGLGETADPTGGRGPGPRTPLSDRMLDAGDEVNGVAALMDAHAMALLAELLEPRRVHTATPQRWRLVVALVTGVKAEAAQADQVRDAAALLADAYRELDHSRAREGWRPRAGEVATTFNVVY